MKTLKNDIFIYVKDKYGTEPDYPWIDTPDIAIIRHNDTKKWYGAIMPLSVSKLGINEDRKADVLNLKCDPLMIGSLRMENGIYPAYHMNKNSWISVILDGTVDMEKIKFLLDMSFALTDKKPAKKSNRKPRTD